MEHTFKVCCRINSIFVRRVSHLRDWRVNWQVSVVRGKLEVSVAVEVAAAVWPPAGLRDVADLVQTKLPIQSIPDIPRD